MRFLLDTHALLWLLEDDPRLRTSARLRLIEGEVWASIVSVWEVAIKVRTGRLNADVANVGRAITTTGLRPLGLEPQHLSALRWLPRVVGHRDPFDHVLLAQAQFEGLTFVSDDPWTRNYPVTIMTCAGAVTPRMG